MVKSKRTFIWKDKGEKVYTITGGFRAVTTTDLIQSIVMSLALVAVLVYGIGAAGGWDAVVANAQSLPGYLTMMASHNAAEGTATSYSLLDIVSTMAWGLGYFGMPHILLRFMAIEDEKKLVLSRRIASVWVVIAMTASIIIGMVGLGMTKAGALEYLSGSSSETVIVRIANLIAQHGILAAVLAGLILAGILAATMSTADSQMLAAASSVSQNNLRGEQMFGIALVMGVIGLVCFRFMVTNTKVRVETTITLKEDAQSSTS